MLGRLAAASILALALCDSALAETATLTVTAELIDNCDLNDGTLDFGELPGAIVFEISSSATLTITCVGNPTVAVRVNAGQNATGIQRRMKRTGSTNFLNYNLYLDSAHVNALNPDETAAFDVSGGSITLYGGIPGPQTVLIGQYQDIATVEVVF